MKRFTIILFFIIASLISYGQGFKPLKTKNLTVTNKAVIAKITTTDSVYFKYLLVTDTALFNSDINILGNSYFTGSIKVYDTIVFGDGTKMYTGAPIVIDTGDLWTQTGYSLYPMSLNDSIAIGSTHADERLDVTGNGIFTGNVTLDTLKYSALLPEINTDSSIYASKTFVANNYRSIYDSMISVVKRTSTSLLLPKINNMLVFSSNTVTDTLPSVTIADSGLSITIKNVGTYTDLVKVVAKGGKTIDGITLSSLTRWNSKTYVVSNTANWYVKEKNTRADNIYDVASSGSFTTIAEALAFLNLHMTAPSVIRLGGGIYTLSNTQTINLPYPLTIEGLSYGESIIRPTTGMANKPMFRCLTESYFKMIAFDTIGLAWGTNVGEDAIRFVGAGQYNEVKDCSFYGMYDAILDSTSAELWLFELDITATKNAGIRMHSALSGAKIRTNAVDFAGCKKGIFLEKGSGAYVDINGGCSFRCASVLDTGLVYRPATFTTATLYLSGTKWNNVGTYVKGVDYTRADGRDANFYDQNNAGREDKSPHLKINVLNSTDTVRFVTGGTWKKAKFTVTGTPYVCKWTVGTNRYTYQPINKRDVWIDISGNFSMANSNRVMSIAIVRNGISGTRYAEMTTRYEVTANQVETFPTILAYLEDMGAGDYFEIWVSGNNNGDIITISDLQIKVISQ